MKVIHKVSVFLVLLISLPSVHAAGIPIRCEIYGALDGTTYPTVIQMAQIDQNEQRLFGMLMQHQFAVGFENGSIAYSIEGPSNSTSIMGSAAMPSPNQSFILHFTDPALKLTAELRCFAQ